MKFVLLMAMLAWQQAEAPKRPALEGKVIERGGGVRLGRRGRRGVREAVAQWRRGREGGSARAARD